VLNDVLGTNPVGATCSRSDRSSAPKGAEALTADQLRELLTRLRT
jgi:hypothetical protein